MKLPHLFRLLFLALSLTNHATSQRIVFETRVESSTPRILFESGVIRTSTSTSVAFPDHNIQFDNNDEDKRFPTTTIASSSRSTTGRNVPHENDNLGAGGILTLCILAILVIIFISLVILELITAIVLLLTWNFQKILGKLILMILLCRLSAFCVTLGKLQTGNGITCTILGATSRFLSVSSFTLLVAINYNFWKTFSSPTPSNAITESLRKSSETRHFIGYSVTALFVAGIFTGLSVTLEETFSFTEHYATLLTPADTNLSTIRGRIMGCDDNKELLLYAVPINCVLMLIALALCILTITSIRRQRNQVKFARSSVKPEKENRQGIDSFKLFWKLSVLMGVGWILEQVTYGVTHITAVYTDVASIHFRFVPIIGAFLIDVVADICLFRHFVCRKEIVSQIKSGACLSALRRFARCCSAKKHDQYRYDPILAKNQVSGFVQDENQPLMH